MISPVAIIGGGCSGTLVAVRLLHECRDPPRMILIERGTDPALGISLP